MSFLDWFAPPRPSTDVDVLKNSLDAIRVQMNSLSTNITGLTGKLAGTQRDVVNLRARLDTMDGVLRDTVDQLTDLQLQISNLSPSTPEHVQGLLGRIDELRDEFTAMGQHLSQFEELVIQQFETDEP